MVDVQREIPAKALTAPLAEMQFGDNGDGAKTAPISMVARAGTPIEHWYFGKVVHDFAGMKHKDRIPIDYVHSEADVIGYVNKFDAASGDLRLSGALVPFKDSDRATEVIFKNRAGVPYEASIDFRDSIVMEELQQGQAATVNGNLVEGPATIIRQWTLRGVAVCPYGADPNTSSQLAGSETVVVTVKTEGQPMATEETTVVEETTEAAAAEVAPVETESQAEPVEVVPAEAATQANTEGMKFLKAFGQQGAQWYVEGKSFEDAGLLFAQQQTDRISQLEAANADLEKRLAAALKAGGESSAVDFQPGEKNDNAHKGFAGKIRIAGSKAE